MSNSFHRIDSHTVELVNAHTSLGIHSLLIDLEVGVVSPLSTCCGASLKGVEAEGVMCRECGDLKPVSWGIGWTLAQAAEAIFCPDCGDTLGGCPFSPLEAAQD